MLGKLFTGGGLEKDRDLMLKMWLGYIDPLSMEYPIMA
jgi:hypothetical protein